MANRSHAFDYHVTHAFILCIFNYLLWLSFNEKFTNIFVPICLSTQIAHRHCHIVAWMTWMWYRICRQYVSENFPFNFIVWTAPMRCTAMHLWCDCTESLRMTKKIKLHIKEGANIFIIHIATVKRTKSEIDHIEIYCSNFHEFKSESRFDGWKKQ